MSGSWYRLVLVPIYTVEPWGIALMWVQCRVEGGEGGGAVAKKLMHRAKFAGQGMPTVCGHTRQN